MFPALFFVYLVDMDSAISVAGLGINWVIVLAFTCVILLVACCIFVFLLCEGIQKQKLYDKFQGSVNEFIVVLSRRREFLYGLPMYTSDPLFARLSSGETFQDLLQPKDWSRMKLYFDEVEKHQNMLFVFSVKIDPTNVNSDQSRVQWYEMKTVLDYVSVQEYRYICFIKNFTRENENRKERERIQVRLDNLLQNTGDFLWNFEVDERKFRLLTPLMDEEHRVIPQSTGYVDIRKMMPESDYNLLNSVVNARVKDFHTYGSRGDPFETIKLRLYGVDKAMVWYCFRCRLMNDEDNRLVLQGSARRMDMVLDNPVSDDDDKEAMLSAALSFPDVRVLWVDTNFTIQGCNQAFATDFQIVNPKDIYGKNLDTVFTSRILPHVSKIFSDVFDTGRSVAWKGGFMKENSLLMFNAVPLKSKDNVLHSVLGVYMMLDKSDFVEYEENV